MTPALTSAQLEQLSREADRRALQPPAPTPTEVLLRRLEALAAPTPAELLTQDQLAKALNCSARTVFTMRQQGCPHLMLLESPRFVLAEVVHWMETRGAT